MAKKTAFKPNYAVHPSETIEEFCMYQLLGQPWAKKIQDNGITKQDAMLFEALFSTPRQFFINLQKNYDKTVKRLAKEGENA